MARKARTDADSLLARIEANSILEPNSGCFLWTAGTYKFGYGKIGIRLPDGTKKTMTAHRLAWELHRGQVPKPFVVMHKCDVPSCVNINHLELGTQTNNLKDMWIKGRARPQTQPSHERPNAKLSWELVRSIRSSLVPSKELAKQLGVSNVLIYRVRNGEGWKE